MGEKEMYLEVDEGLCIACRLCEERAPENLAMDDDDHAARVIKQPVGETEMASCAEAVEYCPTAGLIATTPTAKKNAA